MLTHKKISVLIFTCLLFALPDLADSQKPPPPPRATRVGTGRIVASSELCPAGNPTSISTFNLRAVIRTEGNHKSLFYLSDDSLWDYRPYDWLEGTILESDDYTREKRIIPHVGEIVLKGDFDDIESLRGKFSVGRGLGGTRECPSRAFLRLQAWDLIAGGAVGPTRIQSLDRETSNWITCDYLLSINIGEIVSSLTENGEGQKRLLVAGELCTTRSNPRTSSTVWKKFFELSILTNGMRDVEIWAREAGGSLDAAFGAKEPSPYTPSSSIWQNFYPD